MSRDLLHDGLFTVDVVSRVVLLLPSLRLHVPLQQLLSQLGLVLQHESEQLSKNSRADLEGQEEPEGPKEVHTEGVLLHVFPQALHPLFLEVTTLQPEGKLECIKYGKRCNRILD